MLSIDRFLDLQEGQCVVLRQDRFKVMGYEEIAGRQEPVLINVDTGERLFAGIYAAHLLRVDEKNDGNEGNDDGHENVKSNPAVSRKIDAGFHGGVQSASDILCQLMALTPADLSANHPDIDAPESLFGRKDLPRKGDYLLEFDQVMALI